MSTPSIQMRPGFCARRWRLFVCLALMASAFSATAARADNVSDAAGAQSNAASDRDCKAFGWPVAQERALFDDPDLPHRNSGARLRRIDRAVDLKLLPTTKVQFFLPPLKAANPHSYSGFVTFFGVPVRASIR